jgi:hypothetical protein
MNLRLRKDLKQNSVTPAVIRFHTERIVSEKIESLFPFIAALKSVSLIRASVAIIIYWQLRDIDLYFLLLATLTPGFIWVNAHYWFIRDYSNPGFWEELLNACHQSKPGKLFVKWALVHLGKMTKGEYKIITESDFKTILKQGEFSKKEVALFKKECATVEAGA